MSGDPPVAIVAPTRPYRRLRRFVRLRRLARYTGWTLFAIWAVLVAGWLSLHWLILPHIEEWREPIEARASRLLGAPVRIGAVKVHSSGWVPAIELSDVELLDSQQRSALKLARVFATLSPRSLLALEPRFSQLLIDAPSLDVRRDASGRIRVGGLDVFGQASAGVDESDAAADWFFAQHEFVIRGGTLRWIDETRSTAPLVLSRVDLIVRNGLTRHDLRIDATPPEQWGERFSVRGRFTQPVFARSGDWRRWSGSSYADLPRADLHELGRRVTLPIELREGDGALRGWFEWREGEPVGASLDVALRAVDVRLDRSVQALDVEHVQGRIDAEKKGDRRAVAVRAFGFRTGDGLAWLPGNASIAWREGADGIVTGGELDAERLDIGVMADIATRVPLGAALRTLLAELRPRGVVTGLSTQWEGPLDAPERYRVRGVLSDLSLAARPAAEHGALGRPGLAHAAIRLDASEAGGNAELGVRAGHLDLPGVFAEPVLPLERLDAKLGWKIEHAGADAPTVTVKVAEARFANADAKGEVAATWRTGGARAGRFPGELELDGRLSDAVATRTARYLPLGLPEDVRAYLGRAIQAGTIASATIRVRGDLRDFPFHDARSARDGELRIAAKIDGVTFAAIPAAAGASPSPMAPTARSATPGLSASPGLSAPPGPSAPLGPSASPASPGPLGPPAAPESWPPLTAVAGEVVVDRKTLAIRNVRARSAGVEWTAIDGRIADLGAKARLDIDGTARGPLAEMLRIVNATPIGRWTGRALAATTASGPAELKLGLGVALAQPAETTARGTLELPGNDVRITPDTPLLGNAKATIAFTHKSFTVSAASARVLGGEATFEGGSSNGLNGGDGQRFSGRGIATAEALRQAPELGTLARLAGQLSGQTGYRAELAFGAGRTQLAVASNLVGLAADLPAPFGKAAAAALPLRVRIGPEAASPGALRSGTERTNAGTARDASKPLSEAGVERTTAGSPRDASAPPREALQVELGSLLQAMFLRETSGGIERVVRGAIRITDSRAAPAAGASDPVPGEIEPIALPASGVAAAVAVKSLDVDAWQALADRLHVEPARPQATAPAAPLVFDPTGGSGYVPNSIALRVGDLALGARHLGNVTAGLSQQGELWRANVDADELAGYVEYRPARSTGAARVFARLTRLSLPKGEAERVETLLDAPPASVPALDIVVDDFELRGKHLGRLEIEAANRAVPGRDAAREWQLAKLNLTMPEAQLSASGTWGAGGSATNAPRRAALGFTLALADSGALLERLGMGRVVRGGKGSLTGDLSWPGSPLSPDVAKMTGQVKVAIDSGQFLKAGPGAARLLGVLSLQSLPRRLLLDFRDVFAEGFSFDNVTGDVRIGQGQASTNNLRMRGVAAAVLMEGSADLVDETEDLRVVVVPEINAGTASLAYAVINPALGLGTFLAQYFLRKPLMAASTREFRITGPWDDPKVERVARSVVGASPAGAATTEPAPR